MVGSGIGQKFVFGPSFYEGFRNWPVRWVYDVPFAKQNHTDSYDEAKAAIDNIGLENLEALEIGNEVNIYVGQGVRPLGWDPAEYVSDFLNYSSWLSQALGLPDRPINQVLMLTGPESGNWTVYVEK